MSGKFKPGFDARRHIFTKEECIAGYNALVEKIMREKFCGVIVAKQWAFKRMCKTEAIRYDNPAIEVKEVATTKTSADIRRENNCNKDGSTKRTTATIGKQAWKDRIQKMSLMQSDAYIG